MKNYSKPDGPYHTEDVWTDLVIAIFVAAAVVFFLLLILFVFAK